MKNWLGLGVGLVLAIGSPASALMIDDFTTGIQSVVSNGSTFSSVAAPGALGGERDLRVTLTSSQGRNGAEANSVFPGMLLYESLPFSTGSLVVQWDGLDGSSSLAQGLGGIDLTESGAHKGISLRASSDQGGTISIDVYSSGTDVSRATISLLSDNSFHNYFVSFLNDFSVGGGSGASFGSVSAIAMTIDGTSNPATDIAIDRIQTSAPEPGTLMLFGFGLAGVRMMGRRRRSGIARATS